MKFIKKVAQTCPCVPSYHPPGKSQTRFSQWYTDKSNVWLLFLGRVCFRGVCIQITLKQHYPSGIWTEILNIQISSQAQVEVSLIVILRSVVQWCRAPVALSQPLIAVLLGDCHRVWLVTAFQAAFDKTVCCAHYSAQKSIDADSRVTTDEHFELKKVACETLVIYKQDAYMEYMVGAKAGQNSASAG